MVNFLALHSILNRLYDDSGLIVPLSYLDDDSNLILNPKTILEYKTKKHNPYLRKILQQKEADQPVGFSVSSDNGLLWQGCLCVPGE